MKVSENIIEGRRAYHELKSRQSSMRKNQSNQNTQNNINFPTYRGVPLTQGVQVSVFKLPITIPANQRKNQDCSFQFGKPNFQAQINQLQINIQSQMMQTFQKEFSQLCKSFEQTPNANYLKSNPSVGQQIKTAPYTQSKIQPIKSHISKDSQNQSIKTVPNYQPCFSRENQQAPIRQPVPEIRNSNKHHINELSEYFKTVESHERSKQIVKNIYSPTLQLSSDQKQFQRSLQFIKGNHSQIKSDQAELSLISTQKIFINKRLPLINTLYDQLLNGKKVLVMNKLIFLGASV